MLNTAPSHETSVTPPSDGAADAPLHGPDRDSETRERIARLREIVIAKEAERAALAVELAEAKAARRADLDGLLAAFEASQIDWTNQRDDLKRELRALTQDRELAKAELAELSVSAAGLRSELDEMTLREAEGARDRIQVRATLETREAQRATLVQVLTTAEATRGADAAALAAACDASRAENIGEPDPLLDTLRSLARDRAEAVARLVTVKTSGSGLEEAAATVLRADAAVAQARGRALAAHEARCQAQWAELQALRGTAAALTGERDQLRNERDGFAEQLRGAERQIELMRTSTSWKLTGPLRRFMRLVRRR